MVLQTLSGITSLKDALIELIRFSSFHLPLDVVDQMKHFANQEEPTSRASKIFDILLENIRLAQEHQVPLCQDTGTLTFYVQHVTDFKLKKFHTTLLKAIEEATERHILRPNSVDSLTGENPGTNLGTGFPVVHFEPWERKDTQIQLLLKGGGCENVSFQYALPYTKIQADRDLEGIRKVILYGIHQAQGKGCAPGILGVGIGGDRATSYSYAKKQLLRPLSDKNSNADLQTMETEILQQANTLGIGPMGLGGNTTLLGIKIGAMHRIPASFYVSGSYLCWAARRHSLLCHEEGHFTIE